MVKIKVEITLSRKLSGIEHALELLSLNQPISEFLIKDFLNLFRSSTGFAIIVKTEVKLRFRKLSFGAH